MTHLPLFNTSSLLLRSALLVTLVASLASVGHAEVVTNGEAAGSSESTEAMFNPIVGESNFNSFTLSALAATREATATYHPATGDVTIEIGPTDAQGAGQGISGIRSVGAFSSGELINPDFTAETTALGTPLERFPDRFAYFQFSDLPAGTHRLLGVLPLDLILSAPEAFAFETDPNATRNNVTLSDGSDGGTLSFRYVGSPNLDTGEPGFNRVVGFQVASIPEPSSIGVLAIACLGVVRRRR